MQEKPQLLFLDAAKGIGILLVVIGHSIVPLMRQSSFPAFLAYDFIYSFHMALFMAMSGYLYELYAERYQKQGFFKFMLAKLRTLMLPYLSFSILAFLVIAVGSRLPILFGILKQSGYTAVSLSSIPYRILTFNGHIDQHLWFVYSLFFCFLITFLTRGFLLRPAGLLLVFALYCLPSFLEMAELIRLTCKFFIFFTLGRHYKTIDRLTSKRCIPLYVCILLASYAVWALWSGWLKDSLPFIVPLLRLTTAISGSLAVLSIAAFLSVKRAGAFLCGLGQYSFDIYLMHQPFVVSAISTVLTGKIGLPYLPTCIISSAAGIALPVLVSKYLIRPFRPISVLLLGHRSKALSKNASENASRHRKAR